MVWRIQAAKGWEGQYGIQQKYWTGFNSYNAVFKMLSNGSQSFYEVFAGGQTLFSRRTRQTCRALQRRPFPSFSVATCSAAYKNNSYLQSSKALLACGRTSFLSVHVLPSPNLYISTSFRFVFALSPPCFSLHFPECCHSAGLVKHAAALYSRPGPPCTHPTPRPSPQLNFYSSFI